MYKLFICILLITTCYPQKNEPDAILKKVKDNFNRVQDYQADLKVKVDVDFIKVPDMKAKLYFKQPDKMQLDSEGFAMLPKGGMNFSPSSMLSGNYTAFYEKDYTENGTKFCIIKIIPLGDAGDVVLSTLWIDLDYYRIVRIETSTKTQGTYQIELSYPQHTDYPLPSSMTFIFNLDKMNLPKGLADDMDRADGKSVESKKEAQEKTTTGKVYINYSDYRINQGLSDSIFKEPGK
jgi:outer membrane lipoprotein-sorting protein